MIDFEKRIIAALNSDDFTSDEIEALIAETERAITAAEEAAAAERERALDAIASPDPVHARDAMQAAEFAVERLRKLVPRLQARFRQAIWQEDYDRCLPRYTAVKERRDKAAAQLRNDYPTLANQLAPLLMQIADIDREWWAVNEAAPDGAGMYLKSVEEEARGRKGLLHDLYLPGWEPGSANFWPRRR